MINVVEGGVEHLIFHYYLDTYMKTVLPLIVLVLSSIAIIYPLMADTVISEDTLNSNKVRKPMVSPTGSIQKKKSPAVVKHSKKKGGKNLDVTPQPVLIKRDNSDGTITYKTAGKPTADLSETISLKESKEIDKQAKETDVKIIDIKEKPVMTKKANSDGTVTYNVVGDSKSDSPETVPQKQSKNIEKQAESTGVKIIEIKEEFVMTKKLNSDGTVTYNPVGEPISETSGTILKTEGKDVDDKYKEQGVKVIDVTPKKATPPQQ